MNKLRLIERFESVADSTVPIEAVKLYLLLLAECDESGYGEIPLGTVRRAVGNELDKLRIQELIDELAALNLVRGFLRKELAEGYWTLLFSLVVEGTEDSDGG